MVEIRKERIKSDIGEIAERIKRRKSSRKMSEESKEDYYSTEEGFVIGRL